MAHDPGELVSQPFASLVRPSAPPISPASPRHRQVVVKQLARATCCDIAEEIASRFLRADALAPNPRCCSDGDTIALTNGPRVRLVQIDTPKVYFGVECSFRAASKQTKQLLPSGHRRPPRCRTCDRPRRPIRAAAALRDPGNGRPQRQRPPRRRTRHGPLLLRWSQRTVRSSPGSTCQASESDAARTPGCLPANAPQPSRLCRNTTLTTPAGTMAEQEQTPSTLLAALPPFQGARRLNPFPRLASPVLVVEADVPPREPPLDEPHQGGAPAPTVRVAVALAVVRVVDTMDQAPSHPPPSVSVANERVERIAPHFRASPT